MKIKAKKKLYRLFGGTLLITFTGILGWYIAGRYQSLGENNQSNFNHPQAWVTVIEEKEPSNEEKQPLPEISEEELSFRARAKEILKDFPGKEVLHQPERDHHRPPPELTSAGAELGAIEDLLDKNPHLLREGLRFYRQCALQENILTSLRALCLHNLKVRAKSAGIESRIRWQIFPSHLHRLADKLN